MDRNKFSRNLKMLLITITAFIYAIMPMTSLAYVQTSTNVDEEGDWEVTNADSDTATVAVTMYMMMQPEYAQSSGFRGSYWFWCEEGTFQYEGGYEETSAGLHFFFRPDNANVVDVYDDLQVWLWEFNIEPGTYKFVNANGLNHVLVLSQSLGSTLITGDDVEAKTRSRETINAESVVLEDGDSIRLYALFGDEKSSPLTDDGWITNEDNVNTLIAYAREKEASFGGPVPVEEGEKTTIEVEKEMEEPEVTEEPEEEGLSFTEEEEQVNKEEPAKPVINTPVTEEKETKSKVPIMIVCVVIVVGVFVIGWIKKNGRNSDNQ